MKLATRLIPTVAMKNVIAASTVRSALSTRAMTSAGFVRISPNSIPVPAVRKSVRSEKTASPTGRPSRLPSLMSASVRTNREKSP